MKDIIICTVGTSLKSGLQKLDESVITTRNHIAAENLFKKDFRSKTGKIFSTFRIPAGRQVVFARAPFF